MVPKFLFVIIIILLFFSGYAQMQRPLPDTTNPATFLRTATPVPTLENIKVAEDLTAVQGDTLFFYGIPDSFNDQSQAIWTYIGEKIITSPQKTIVMYWSGYGGNVNMGYTFGRFLEVARTNGKHIIFKVIGPAMSMHALDLCHGSVVATPGATILFHWPFSTSFIAEHAPEWLLEIFPSLNKSYKINPGVRNENDIMWDQCVASGIISEKERMQIETEHTTLWILIGKYGINKHVMKSNDWEL